MKALHFCSGLVAVVSLASLSCSGTGGGGGGASGGGGFAGGLGGSGATGTGATGAFSGTGGTGGVVVDSGSGGSTPTGPAEVFGHGPDDLYRLDPDTKAVTPVGPFNGCSGVLDIALDKDSNMYGTTEDTLWKIDPKTANCQQVSTGGPYPNSLSFVPQGVLGPTEVLVGYQDTDYVRIDTTSGGIQVVKAGALINGMISSGDIVSVIGGGTYLTVKGGPCDPFDCIVELEPKTGTVLKNLGTVLHSAVFGLGFWAGSAYGFTSAGELFEITFGTNSVTTTPISIPSAPANLKFWGAGSTTSAPPVPR
ncbi:MAG: hypothetical protein R3B13_39950 [Polyangiaceae bacterium]